MRKNKKKLKKEIGASFACGFMEGYFETTSAPATGIWFIDYNQALGRMYSDYTGWAVKTTADSVVSGRVGCGGIAEGTVRVVEELTDAEISAGEILVCKMTTPDYLPLMQVAAGIVTDLGGILSHAAIVARELKKPCLTATGNATAALKTGMRVRLDADQGVVTRL